MLGYYKKNNGLQVGRGRVGRDFGKQMGKMEGGWVRYFISLI